MYSSKKERQEKFSEQKNVKHHDFREGDQVWYLDKSKMKAKSYESSLFQVIMADGKIVVRHSTAFKRYKNPISPPNLKLIDETETDNKDNETRNENDHENSMIVYDEPSPSDNRTRMEANQPPHARQNDIPVLHDGRKRGRRGGRNNVGTHALEAQQRVRFEGPQRDDANLRDNANLRRGRSAGPAPMIPHVLPAQPERSAQMRRQLAQIHGLVNENGNDDEI